MLSLVLAAVIAAVPTSPDPQLSIPRGTVPADVTPDPRPPVRP